MAGNSQDPKQLSEKLRRKAAQKWIDEAPYIPKDVPYDFLPLCEALVEPFIDISDAFVPPPEKKTGDSHIQNDSAGKLPKKGRDSGRWDYVRYVPHWMDPDYNEDIIETPNGTRKRNVTGDALFKLRPALRLTDQFRNPTEYAQRFGIAEGRLDGRSRMSPTWSRTRNPLDDLTNQVSLLSDTERKKAKHQSRELFKKEKTVPAPGQEIHLKVMQELLSQNGLLSNEELATQLRVGASNGLSLDEMVDELEKKHPGIKRAHQVYLENALQDQDYQRMILNGMTTDELIQNNVQDLGRGGRIDLDNSIHYLFSRDKWHNSTWKGSRPHSPKYVYSVNGVREEWDVATNDTLWEALQPALRLVTQVLGRNNPQIEAIYNMNTRQPVPADQDYRKNRSTPTLTKYVLEQDIDMNQTYPELRQLHEKYGYDWRSNVLQRVLDKCLRLDIGSCFVAPGYSGQHKNGVEEWEPWGFGVTDRHANDDTKECRIDITIGGELIWPLLMPQYSPNEKMMCSFVIANTLLHEFAHAIHHAQVLLVTKDWIHPRNQDPEVTNLLLSLQNKLFDLNSGPGEPFFEDSPDMELGFDVEQALWGFFPCSPIVQNIGISKDLETFASAVYAVSRRPRRGEILRSGTVQPGFNFSRPLPIDFVTKLFSKRFWATDFSSYEHMALQVMPEAPLQMMPKGRTLKSTIYDQRTIKKPGDQVYKQDTNSVIRAVSEILVNSRHHVLGFYLQALADEVPRPLLHKERWRREALSWKHKHIHPLQASADSLFAQFRESEDINRKKNSQRQERLYNAYRNEHSPYDDNIMSPVEWRDKLNASWDENFRDGGWLMQRLLDVHNQMQKDLGDLQLMVFEYLSLSVEHRSFLHGRDVASRKTSPIALVEARLTSFQGVANTIIATVDRISMRPELTEDRVKWDSWRTRFTNNAAQYKEMLSAIKNADQMHPDDITWKKQFTRVPTAYWRPLYQRYVKMAEREYKRADPVVQKAFEECVKIIKKTSSLAPTVELPTPAEIKDIQDTLDRLPRFDPVTMQSLIGPPQSMFNAARRTGRAGPPTSRTNLPSATTTVPRDTTPGSAMFRFGVPGVTPPRRILGVQKSTNNAQQKSAYQDQDYITNKLAAQGTEEATDFFQSGIPQPIIDLLPKQVGGGGGKRRGGLTIPPFPNPYASRVMLTSEVKALEEQKRLAEQAARTANNASGVYTALPQWQTRRHSNDSDSSS
ncbi:hypothetical protein HD806DRAFT_548127 [Xylariaceae sp. AK1471]|nr:hypothetical protein HD806DRAFT_548127 [Xylariaceae sp. AK1471]